MSENPTKEGVSIKRVAELAGVSIATVSRCLNEPDRVREKTRLKVQEAIIATGYAPNTLARNFRRGRTNLIMVVLPSVGDPFFTEVLQGIRAIVAAQGYALVISETSDGALSAAEVGAMLLSRQADGFILLASHYPFGRTLPTLAGHRAQPVVIGCETISDSLDAFPSVHIDNIAAAREATSYLTAQGHERVAFMSGQADSLLTKDRERGYRTSMKEAGLTVDEDWVMPGNMTIDGAMVATRRLLTHPRRPTAIFCANDEMAMGCLQALREAGLSVPGDLSVMGFDDVRYAATVNPPLTTVAQPARFIGERVAARLLEALDNGEDQGPEIVPHRLVVRGSVGPPPERTR